MIGKCLTKSGGSDNPWVISQASDMEKYRNKDYEGQFIKYTGPQTNEYKPGTYQVVANFFNVGDNVNSLYYSFSNTEVNQTLLKNLYNDIASTGTITNEDGRWFAYFFSDYLVQRNYTLLKFDNGKELVMTWLYGQEGPGSTIKHDEYYLGYGTRTDYQAQPKNSLVVVVDGDTVKTVNNTEVLSTVQYINKNSGPVNKYVYKNSPYSYVLAPVYSLAKLQTPAANNDIIPGKEAYDDNGNKLTGNLKSYNNPLKPTSQEEYDAIITGNDYLNNYIEFNSKTTKTEVGEYSGTWAMGDTVNAIYFDTSKTPQKPTDWSNYDHSIDVGSTIKFKTLMSGDVNAPIGLPRGLFWGNGLVGDGTNATFIMDSTTGIIIWSDAKVTGDDDAGWQYSVLTGDLKNKLEIDPDYAYTLTIISDSYNWNGVYTFKNSPAKEVKTYYPLDPLTNTATASEVAKDKEVYDGEGNKIVGTYELRLQEKTATPGLNPQNILPDNGYTGLSKVMVDGVGITPARTVIPGTADIHVNPDSGDLGIESVLVGGDANLLPENIKQGVSIFNVEGTLVEGTGDKLKLYKPLAAIDFDSDILAMIPCPLIQNVENSKIRLNTNGTEEDINIVERQYGHSTNTSQKDKNSVDSIYSAKCWSPHYVTKDLSTLNAGKYDFKIKHLAGVQVGEPNISMEQALGGKVNLGFTKNGYTYKPFETRELADSDYSDIIHYERWNFTNNVNNLRLDGVVSGTLNYMKYDTGTLVDYIKKPNYSFNLNPSNSSSTGQPDSGVFGVVPMRLNGDSLVFDRAIDGYYNSPYAKISFTLEEPTEVKIKYQIKKSSGSSSLAIVIGPMDVNYTSFGYSSKLANPVVDFSTNSDFAEKEYSFGTLAAGEHFYFVEFYDYTSDQFAASMTPVYEKIKLENKLPADITVINSEFETPEYEYNAYTGKFSIPMTGNITMTANGSTATLLDELYITPATWDVNTSILTWDYSIDGAMYHIQTPDNQEYITAEKSYDFTGKLGEVSTDLKRVKIWATKDSQESGRVFVKIRYNPGYAVVHNKEELDSSPTNSIVLYEDDSYIVTKNTQGIDIFDKNTKEKASFSSNRTTYFEIYNNNHLIVSDSEREVIILNLLTKKWIYDSSSLAIQHAFALHDYIIFSLSYSNKSGFYIFNTATEEMIQVIVESDKNKETYVYGYNEKIIIIKKDDGPYYSLKYLSVSYEDIKNLIDNKTGQTITIPGEFTVPDVNLKVSGSGNMAQFGKLLLIGPKYIFNLDTLTRETDFTGELKGNNYQVINDNDILTSDRNSDIFYRYRLDNNKTLTLVKEWKFYNGGVGYAFGNLYNGALPLTKGIGAYPPSNINGYLVL